MELKEIMLLKGIEKLENITEIVCCENYGDEYYWDLRVIVKVGAKLWEFVDEGSFSGWGNQFHGVTMLQDNKELLKDWCNFIVDEEALIDSIDLELIDEMITSCIKHGATSLSVDDETDEEIYD